MDYHLKGKVAIVTGAARGIGASVATMLAAEGATVYLADLDEHRGTDRAAALKIAGGSAHARRLDVADPADVERVFGEILAREARVDILVNSAGILRTGPLATSQSSDWEALSRINVGGVFACSKAVVGAMGAHRYGRILNLASISAFKGGGSIGNVLYGASKAAVVALTQGFAREYGPLGINVNAIAPAVAETPMTSGSFDEPGARERVARTIPLGRLAQPEEIANLAVFLVSDVAAYINGSIVVIDGGLLTV